ncbi:hypothetical protein R3P38DRAFT_3430938 [Favolaschia claudopus]|uniref:Uncharacterized protein n=1 Tax=Favolaschia claudopus TaxID=2862362 RepID=A0AAV9ZUW6_9AGAR
MEDDLEAAPPLQYMLHALPQEIGGPRVYQSPLTGLHANTLGLSRFRESTIFTISAWMLSAQTRAESCLTLASTILTVCSLDVVRSRHYCLRQHTIYLNLSIDILPAARCPHNAASSFRFLNGLLISLRGLQLTHSSSKRVSRQNTCGSIDVRLHTPFLRPKLSIIQPAAGFCLLEHFPSLPHLMYSDIVRRGQSFLELQCERRTACERGGHRSAKMTSDSKSWGSGAYTAGRLSLG